MGYFLGVVVGSIISSILFGMSSYYFWEKHTQDNHDGKKMFFAFFSFFIGGLLGFLGGLPTLIISYALARSYKTKPAIKSEEKFEKMTTAA